MKKEDLMKELENIKLPDIELRDHRRRLKMALLNSSHLKNKREATFLETVKAYTIGVSGTLSSALVARRPVWRITLMTVFAVFLIFATLISIPQTSGVLKSTFFPEGRREISGPQLTTGEHQKAMDILLADSRIQNILGQGAVIDKILPIQVEAEILNPETGSTEIIQETWAQAWIVKGGKDWGVQVDLVRGQIISITE